MSTDSTYNSVYKDPLHLTSGDHSLLQIVPHVFSGKSFMHWSRNMKVALISKNKLGFVNGTYPQPASTHASYNDWIRTDYIVMRWILHSLSTTIAESLSYVTSSKQLWDELDERFNQSNAPFLYQLRKNASQIVQGETSVTEYYSRLKVVWEDIRSLDPLPECSCGVLATCTCNLLKKVVDRDNKNNLIDFLMGLDRKFEHLRGQILAMDPLPSVNQAFAKVHQAEVQKSITVSDLVPDMDSVAMAASQQHSSGQFIDNHTRGYTVGNTWKRDGKKPKMDRPYYCDHCHKSGHTRDFCWKLKNQKSRSSVQDARPSSSGGRRFAAHVKEGSPFETDTPCDIPQHTLSNAQNVQAVFPSDPSFVQAVAKELFKLQTAAVAPDSHSLAGMACASTANASTNCWSKCLRQ
ncbi:hypothetical protein RND81_10G144600 [Saponaria officinalis]|uniref:Retrotransposon Copia-like N-terminal domain-containing protein n=1 Tax=Saponaria officinalis TaxID=3572 RepID=A0AAW1I3J0_SAPOF